MIDQLTDGGRDARRREFIGNRCVAIAFDGPWTGQEKIEEEERETYARDAISDILTALCGLPGTFVQENARWKIKYNDTNGRMRRSLHCLRPQKPWPVGRNHGTTTRRSFERPCTPDSGLASCWG